MTAQHDEHGDERGGDARDGSDERRQTAKTYLRFAAMILTAMVAMYILMFAASWEWSHVRWSESRLFMTLTMGGSMGIIMLLWMLGMYKSVKGNVVVLIVSVLMLGGGIALDRSQATVQDTAYMSGMIPHHSLAITRSERAELSDVRVCELARDISLAQRREISEMEWLIEDIEENGIAATAAEAEERPVPEFDVSTGMDCVGE